MAILTLFRVNNEPGWGPYYSTAGALNNILITTSQREAANHVMSNMVMTRQIETKGMRGDVWSVGQCIESTALCSAPGAAVHHHQPRVTQMRVSRFTRTS